MRAAGQGVSSVALKHCVHPSPVGSKTHISSDNPLRWPPKITTLGPAAVTRTAEAWKAAPVLIDCSFVSRTFAKGFLSSSWASPMAPEPPRRAVTTNVSEGGGPSGLQQKGGLGLLPGWAVFWARSPCFSSEAEAEAAARGRGGQATELLLGCL